MPVFSSGTNQFSSTSKLFSNSIHMQKLTLRLLGTCASTGREYRIMLVHTYEGVDREIQKHEGE